MSPLAPEISRPSVGPAEQSPTTGRLRSLSAALQSMATELAQTRRENARLRQENRALRAHLSR